MEKADDQIHDRRLAGAGLADEGNARSGLRIEAQVLHGPALPVGVADVFETDVSFRLLEFQLSLAGLEFLLGQDFTQALQRCHALADLRHDAEYFGYTLNDESEQGLVKNQ